MGGLDAHRVHHGIHGHAAEMLLLFKRDAQFVECLDKLRVYLVHAFLLLRRLGRGIITYGLEINLRNGEMSPVRHGQGEPVSVSLQTEVKQPIRLSLLARNKAYDILVQTCRYYFRIYVRCKTVLIFSFGGIPKNSIIIHNQMFRVFFSE